MSRQSRDELAPDGTILNGYDYNVQVWVLGGVIQPCGHPETMQRKGDGPCCNGYAYAGYKINQVYKHEVR